LLWTWARHLKTKGRLYLWVVRQGAKTWNLD